MTRHFIAVLVSLVVGAATMPSAFGVCAANCQPTSKSGWPLADTYRVGIDPGLSLTGQELNAIFLGIDYWNYYFQSAGLPDRFQFTSNPGMANIIIKLDPTLGPDIGANNAHGPNSGSGIIYLNPRFIDGNHTDWLRTAMAHELGHSIGFNDNDDPSCAGQTIMNRPVDPRWGPFWPGTQARQDECDVKSEQTLWQPPPPRPAPPGGGGPSGCYETDCGAWTPEPLVLDLNGDGVNTTGVNDMVWFDLDGDGTKDHVTWTNANTAEGFLWVNLTGKNRVDNGSELFGIGTQLPDGSKAKNGFDALAIYDDAAQGGNGDGLIDSNDEVWNKLRVWVDVNHDGSCQPGEVNPLHKYGVEGISLSAGSTVIDVNGNSHMKGRYWRHSGNILQVLEIDGVTFQGTHR